MIAWCPALDLVRGPHELTSVLKHISDPNLKAREVRKVPGTNAPQQRPACLFDHIVRSARAVPPILATVGEPARRLLFCDQNHGT
jgi:hypothetical protein